MASKMDDVLAAGLKKKSAPSSDEVEYLLENEVIDIDTLKQFTIPKRKSHKQDVITRVEMMSPEMGELVRMVKQAYKHRDSSDTFVYSRPRIVHNATLLNKFTNKKKRMRSEGYTDKELQETFVFLYFEDDYKACNVCRDGVSIKNSTLTCLGDPEMGVYVSKYSDVLSSKSLKNKASGTLLIFKLIKGRVKVMLDKSTVALDPSPNFDCHVLKPSHGLDHCPTNELFEASQIYVYEYMEDSELADQPSQLLPYALLTFRYDKQSRSPNPLDSISSKYKKSVKRKSDRDSELLHKKHKHLIRKTISSGQQAVESSYQPYHSNHSHPFVPPKEQQLWSGDFKVAEVSLGTVILQSSCPLIDSSLLKWELKVERQIKLSTLNELILDSLVRLDLRKETMVHKDLSVSCGLLHPSCRASEQFTTYLEHLLTNKMVGYAVLSGHLEVFILPIYFVRDYCLVSNEDAHKPMLCCLFVCKESINNMIREHLKNCAMLENAINEEESSLLCNFIEAPASPEPESDQPSMNIRDPRIRFKTKSTKMNPNDPATTKPGISDKCVIASSRLMMLFENMATLQEASKNERLNRPQVSKPDERSDKKSPLSLDNKIDKNRTNTVIKFNKNDPRARKIEAKETSKKVETQLKPPVIPENTIEKSRVEVADKPSESKVDSDANKKFVLPEIVYATAIADPKVRQLLEDLKNKNIIGLGAKPQKETPEETKNQPETEITFDKKDNTEKTNNILSPNKEVAFQVPPQDYHNVPAQQTIQAPPFTSPPRVEEAQNNDNNFTNEGPQFSNYNDNYNYNPDYNVNQPPPFVRENNRFRNDFNSFRGRPFRPFHPRNRMMPPIDPSEHRRRFPNALPDPKSFQQSYMEQPPNHQPFHHQQLENAPRQTHHQSEEHQAHQPPPQNQQPPPHFNLPMRHPPPTHFIPPNRHPSPSHHHQPQMQHHQQQPYHQQQQQQNRYNDQKSSPNRFSNKHDPRIKRSRFDKSTPNENHNNSHHDHNRYNRT